MEHIVWFGVNKKKNVMHLHSVDGVPIIHFLRGRRYRILVLTVLDKETNNEKSLLNEGEESSWVDKNNSTELSYLIEDIDSNYPGLFWAEIELENNGFLKFMHGQLVVKISDFEALKKATVKVLDFYGYFASEKIWEFAVNCNKSLMISFVLAMEDHEITDEFDRMINHTNDIEEEHALLDAEINQNDSE
jgi:hypothetical protein